MAFAAALPARFTARPARLPVPPPLRDPFFGQRAERRRRRHGDELGDQRALKQLDECIARASRTLPRSAALRSPADDFFEPLFFEPFDVAFLATWNLLSRF